MTILQPLASTFAYEVAPARSLIESNVPAYAHGSMRAQGNVRAQCSMLGRVVRAHLSDLMTDINALGVGVKVAQIMCPKAAQEALRKRIKRSRRAWRQGERDARIWSPR